MYITNISKNTKLIPEIHFNIDHAVNTKNSDTTIKIIEEIDSIKIPSEKLAKIYYNFGGSLKLNQSDKFEGLCSEGSDFCHLDVTIPFFQKHTCQMNSIN